jgi:uncharacterized protein YlxW (UPF0749 family)
VTEARGWSEGLRKIPRLLFRRARPRRRGWSSIVPLVLFAAGLLFATTATTARGTQLRQDRTVQLNQLIQQRNSEVASRERQARTLRGQVEADTGAQARSDARVRAQQDRADAGKAAAGLTAVHGPALTVTLNDAPRPADRNLPPGATVDDVVVHQQDVQAVVNALWAGGAEAMSIMNIRVISTSAVRCVGNTLLLQGQVFSPPFTVTAIGDRGRMAAALGAAPGVQAFRQAAADFGLGYQVEQEADVKVPAYDGSVSLSNAQVPR